MGTVVQGSLGFGMGLIAIPVLALLVPQHLPQTLVLVALPLSLFMLWHERSAVRVRTMPWLLIGRVLGVAPAVVVLLVIPVRILQIFFALTTLAAVAIMATRRASFRITPRTQFVAGTASGFIGTAAGLGGPPVALLYASQTGRELRATLALITVVGNIAAVVGYAFGGRLTPIDLTLALIFLIPTGVGLVVGIAVRGHLDGRRLRPAVMTVIAISAVVLLGTALRG
ncbi:sulfite exporter TauE/SafE family protein [Georgenia sp. MJ170]